MVRLGRSPTPRRCRGQVLATRPVAVDPDPRSKPAGASRGGIEQVPPMYSPLKRDGKALYANAARGHRDRARGGAEVAFDSRARPARPRRARSRVRGGCSRAPTSAAWRWTSARAGLRCPSWRPCGVPRSAPSTCPARTTTLEALEAAGEGANACGCLLPRSTLAGGGRCGSSMPRRRVFPAGGRTLALRGPYKPGREGRGLRAGRFPRPGGAVAGFDGCWRRAG